MSDPKIPHTLHAELDEDGCLSFDLDCPYDQADPTRACLMVEEDGTPMVGCLGLNWLDAIGREFPRLELKDPSFPLAVHVAVEGYDVVYLELAEAAW